MAAQAEEATPALLQASWLQAFFSAAKPQDAQALARQQLEAAGLSLDGPTFTQAIARQHQPLIDLFRRAGADIQGADAQGRTPLLMSALVGNWPLFESLLQAGAAAQVADQAKVTPLMVAAMANRAETLKALLARGAALNARDARGHAALHYAVASRSLEALQVLHAAGAECTESCCNGSSLLAHAWATNDWRIVIPILERQPPTLEWSEDSRKALEAALQWKDAAKLRLLLTKHPAPPVRAGETQPILAQAVVARDVSLVRLLLENGASPEVVLASPVAEDFSKNIGPTYLKHYLGEEPGMTVLMLAAGLGQKEIVKELLAHGAKPGRGTDKYKLNAAIFAARLEDPELMQMLLGEDCPTRDEMRVEISLSSQEAVLYRQGIAVYRTPVSTGRSGFATPAGEYVVTDKHLAHSSTIYKVPMPYFMRLNYRDFGMHQGALPGYPASHGCIRLPSAAAQKLFKQVPVGTFVSIR